MLVIILTFLRANWQWIAIALVAAALFGRYEVVRIERDHYEKQVATTKAEFAAYKNNVEAMQTALKSSNAALTLQLKQQEVSRNAATEQFNKALKERIANDKVSGTIAIPDQSVRLLNETTADPSRDITSEAQRLNDGTAQATLRDLIENTRSNNAEHWKCIHQVEDWQEFWKRFVSNVKAAEAVGG